MDHGSRRPEDALAIALHELDVAKALMLEMRAKLRAVITEPADNGCSPDPFCSFATASRTMNEASERHRRAVEGFNAVCKKHVDPTEYQPSRRNAAVASLTTRLPHS